MSKFIVGMTYSSNKYGDYIILEKYTYGKFKIKFIKTGYETIKSSASIYKGELRDPYYPIYFDKGCIGNIKYRNYIKEFYVWRGMLSRCYNKCHNDYKHYGEKGIYVCNKWLCFENFIEDFYKIDGYNKEDFINKKIHLDKDKKDDNNNCYCLEKCSFLNYKENQAIRNRKQKKKTSSKYLGISKLKDGKYQATIVLGTNTKKYLGRYNTEEEEEETNNAYIKYKKEREGYYAKSK